MAGNGSKKAQKIFLLIFYQIIYFYKFLVIFSHFLNHSLERNLMTRFRENPKRVHFSGSGIIGKRSITPDRDSSRMWDHFQTKDKHLFHLYTALEQN